MNIDTKRSLAAKHKLNLTDEQLENVSFIECDDERNLLAVSGTIAVFDKPIYILPGVRLSPLYPNVGCSEDGVVFDRSTGNEISIRPASDEADYPDIVNPDLNIVSLRRIKLHRIVASSWVANDDPVSKPIVNHKDGNKSNPHRLNLEWSNDLLNIRHAFDNGLTPLRKSCIVRDSEKGIRTIYSSVTSAAEAIGVTQSAVTYHLSKTVGPMTLIKGRYEVKYIEDKSPWLSEIESTPAKSEYIFTITYPDGDVKKIYRLSEFAQTYLGYPNGLNVSMAIRRASDKHPDLLFDVIDIRPRKIFEVLDTESNVIKEFDNVQILSKSLSRSESYIKNIWTKRRTVRVGSSMIRPKSSEPWIETSSRFRRVSLKVTDLTTGETRICKSLKEANDWSGVSNRAINAAMMKKRTVGGFCFELLSEKV